MRCGFRQTPARRHGFTLIEMMVLIIIIAVMTSVAVPAYSHFKAKAEFQRNVQSVLGLLAWARDAAVQSNADVTVRFDPPSGTFVVTLPDRNPNEDRPVAMQDNQDATAIPQGRIVQLGENTAVSSFQVDNTDLVGNTTSAGGVQAGQEIRFHDDGTSDAARMTIVSADGQSIAVEVVPSTGRAIARDTVDYGNAY